MPSIKSELENLYLLQEAACGVQHGINRGKAECDWQPFEPTRFVYAYFAFNSFYSINWDETEAKSVIAYWLDSEKSVEEEKCKKCGRPILSYDEDNVCTECGRPNITISEGAKIRKMQKYISNYFVSKISYKSGEKCLVYTLPERLEEKIELFLHEPLSNKKYLFSDIEIDNNITEKVKENFINDIDIMLNTENPTKEFRRSWEGTLRFISSVRNNVFHGSKRIDGIMNKDQIERFKLYTAILLATNELLFEVLEENFSWDNKRKKLVYDYLERRPLERNKND